MGSKSVAGIRFLSENLCLKVLAQSSSSRMFHHMYLQFTMNYLSLSTMNALAGSQTSLKLNFLKASSRGENDWRLESSGSGYDVQTSLETSTFDDLITDDRSFNIRQKPENIQKLKWGKWVRRFLDRLRRKRTRVRPARTKKYTSVIFFLHSLSVYQLTLSVFSCTTCQMKTLVTFYLYSCLHAEVVQRKQVVDQYWSKVCGVIFEITR